MGQLPRFVEVRKLWAHDCTASTSPTHRSEAEMSTTPALTTDICGYCGTALLPGGLFEGDSRESHYAPRCREVLLSQLRQERTARQAAEAASDVGWQQHLVELHVGYTGDGCESGDSRDWTAAAIGLRIRDLENARDEARDDQREARGDVERLRQTLLETEETFSRTQNNLGRLAEQIATLTAERDALRGHLTTTLKAIEGPWLATADPNADLVRLSVKLSEISKAGYAQLAAQVGPGAGTEGKVEALRERCATLWAMLKDWNDYQAAWGNRHLHGCNGLYCVERCIVARYDALAAYTPDATEHVDKYGFCIASEDPHD